jgi:uncharacterized protein (DUF58 family)
VRPPAAVLGNLTRLRLLPLGKMLSERPGERRSGTKGPGLEFAGHRPYRRGDDLRHLDHRLYARFRTPYIREYLADRQLRVVILLDTSVSMNFGQPSKREAASMLVELLAYSALSSGDLVEIGLPIEESIDWSDAVQGASRTETLFRWIERSRPEGKLPLPQAIRAALPRLRSANLVMIVSDWWLEAPAEELRPLAATEASIIGFGMVAPEEEDPLLLGRGPVRMREVGSGTDMDLALDKTSAAEYASLLAAHRSSLVNALEQLGGHYLQMRSDLPAQDMLARLMAAGLIGTYGAMPAQGPGVPL